MCRSVYNIKVTISVLHVLVLQLTTQGINSADTTPQQASAHTAKRHLGADDLVPHTYLTDLCKQNQPIQLHITLLASMQGTQVYKASTDSSN